MPDEPYQPEGPTVPTPPPAAGPVWPGRWVTERLGITLRGAELRPLLGLALRRNPRRAHLLVSEVLGKHVPQRPATVLGAGLDLGRRARALLGDEQAARAVVLGYAETATGLGHAVADGLGPVPYLHSTRRPVPGVAPVGGFQEEHSHATSHLLLPEDPGLLAGDGPLVLVDDEFSTGRTVRNTIAALHALHPRDTYLVVALTDLRSAAHRGELDAFAAELGTTIRVAALATGTVELPDDVLERGRALVDGHENDDPRPVASGSLRRVEVPWPAGLPDGGRHGFTPAHRAVLEQALPTLGGRLASAVGATARRVLVLGCEELMYVPLRLALALQDALGNGAEVRFSTTTRSPVLAVDDPGYAIRTRVTFPAHDAPADGPGPRYAYNVACGKDPDRRFDTVLLVVDSAADTPALHAPGGLVDALRGTTDRVLLTVVPSHVPAPRPPGPPPAHRSAPSVPSAPR
ncbi:hypothetical protein AQ490_11670 [Wenjunlia vitaminophila]|uniref:Phosphoribosyltransferase n=1 Tax=Wenjunlia vitaminophila TaxID=76728 RepID=A0A0T6LKC5_WENVI|nr:hypothetical protein AQ490_11670 [Wenjunlia vitaminophila]